MASGQDAGSFDVSLGCLIAPSLAELATRLCEVSGLGGDEADLVVDATREALLGVLHAKLGRLLILELNAARVTGRLDGADAAARWAQFIELSAHPAFWQALHPHYPTMAARVQVIVDHRCAAALDFARRFCADRNLLGELLGQAPGELKRLSFGAGDSHRGGRAVALLRCAGGALVYKPRSMAIDIALDRWTRAIVAAHEAPSSIRVPAAIDRGSHGWAEFIAHRYAGDEHQLTSFYRGIGDWLAIMRLLGGSDLHAENLIAHGASPVVVDCETLFTPNLPPRPSGLGRAADRAAELVSGTVLGIGLLPGRGLGLGWRGVDSSAVGMLPGQQPLLPQPGIVGAGTDSARMGSTLEAPPSSQNHPSAEPALVRHWPEVLHGFEAMTRTLQRLDAAGELQRSLAAFSGCEIRVVPRGTEVYAEIARMLWHPVSLHDEAPARRRAFDLLQKMAGNVASAPDRAEVIEAEIEDLLIGDVPFFTTRVEDGELHGPRDTRWLPPRHLAEAALAHWRAADFALERNVIRTALVSAYINQGWMPDEVSLLPTTPRSGDIEVRRRQQAARIMREIMNSAIRGEDGSASWISPVLGPTGWSVQPLDQDLYAGTSGIALLAGAYLREAEAGRADPIEALDDLFRATLRSLDLAERKRAQQRRGTTLLRPQTPGGYVGLGSQIWTRLALAEWGLDDGDGVARARDIAEDLPAALAADDIHDVLSGKAGAIPPLLWLAEASGDDAFLKMAAGIGDRLCETAQHRGGSCHWTHSQWPDGVGGFAHGVTGIGWALTKLGRATGESRYLDTAQAAFAFEDALYDAEEKNWTDLRMLDGLKTAAAWCHGSVGIGLAGIDLDPAIEQPRTRATLRRAAAATWRAGVGWNHCACHGDLSAWELLDRAIAAGEGPPGLDRDTLLESILTSLETHGPTCGLTREAFVPGLMPGIGGIAYQLLRAHPGSTLPSVLTLRGGSA
jgi:type 2 lantibiotic biosynthesis protein LanM